MTSDGLTAATTALRAPLPPPPVGVGSTPAEPPIALVRLTRATQTWYSLGETANAAKTVITGLFLLFFYTSVVGLPGALVGFGIALALLADAVVEPWIGHLSDRARALPLGGRHGFMLVGAATIGLCFWAQFVPPRGAPIPVLFAWLVLTGLAVRVANAFFLVPYYALGAELTQDYHGRTGVTALRAAFGLAATMAAAVLSFVLFFPNGPTGADPKLNADSYATMGVALGAAMSLLTLISTLGTLGLRHHRSGSPSRLQVPGRTGLRDTGGMLLAALRPGPFRLLFWSHTFTFVALAVNGALSLAFLTYYAEITSSASLGQLQAAFYVSGLVGSLLWFGFGRRAEKSTLFLGAAVLTGALLLGARILVGPGHVFGTGNPAPLLVGEALAGFAASMFALLPYSMLADVVDHDALEHGSRREGLFVGVLRVGQQVGTALSVLATGVLVDWFAQVVPGQAEQSAATVERIGYAASLLPAALLLPVAVMLVRYPLDRRRVIAIQAELSLRALRLGTRPETVH